MIKELWVDLETTDINYYTAGIIQIGVQVVIDNELIIEKEWNIQPRPEDVWTQGAIDAHHITPAIAQGFLKPAIGFRQIYYFMQKYVSCYDSRDKFFFHGYNAAFDFILLSNWFTKFKSPFFGSFFFFPPMDVAVLAAHKLKTRRDHFTRFRLCDLAAYCGIELDDQRLHSALYDIQITREVYKSLGLDTLFQD